VSDRRFLRTVFPAEPRDFRAKRWVEIAFRTLHLVGSAGAGGGYLYGAPEEVWAAYVYLVVVSGVALVLLELWSNAGWLIQVCGVAILVKLVLLAYGKYWAGPTGWVLVTVVVISAISSHAPRGFRHWSVLHWRRMDVLWPRKEYRP